MTDIHRELGEFTQTTRIQHMAGFCVHTPGQMASLEGKFSFASIQNSEYVIFYDGECKENGPQAIWLKRFWCLMINITRELMCLLVFMFVVHMMLKVTWTKALRKATPQKKTL
jgi:hypothetical protein